MQSTEVPIDCYKITSVFFVALLVLYCLLSFVLVSIFQNKYFIFKELSETELAEYTTLKKELQRLKKEVEELKMHDVWGLGKLSTFTDDAFEMYTG